MTTIRRLISTWMLTLVGSFLLPLVSLAAVSGTTYDAPYTTTTVPATIAEHTVAVEKVDRGATSLQSMANGQALSLLGLSQILDAPKRTTWPSTADEMDDMLGVPGRKVPDGPTRPGRDKTVWRPSDNVKITRERHPYNPDAPDWHRDYHWHLDTPDNPHQRFLPGDDIPGMGGGS